MQLHTYLKLKNITTAEFADLIRVSQAAVSRYATGARRPEWDVLERIVRETDGAVTANDFLPETDIGPLARARRPEHAAA
jgi:transcriptional regulator with XRE-family HTH domain